MRCQCTLQKINDTTWKKPKAGYLDPDPNCPDCNGQGSLDMRIIMGDDNANTWIGVCRLCSKFNGIYFEYLKYNIGPPAENNRPICTNQECTNEFCDWINEKDLE